MIVTVLPFKEGYKYVQVPWSIAQRVKSKMYEYPKDHLDTASILADEFGLDTRDEQDDQQLLSISESGLTPGYVTDDVRLKNKRQPTTNRVLIVEMWRKRR